MLEKMFWYGLGYATARYLIFKSGIEAYKAKELGLINKGEEFKEDIQEQYFQDSY